MNENREISRFAELVAENSNLESVSVREPSKAASIESAIPAFVSGVTGLLFGVGLAQWATVEGLHPAFTEGSRIASSMTLGFGMAWFSFNGFYFLDRVSSITQYAAKFFGFEVDEDEGEPALLRTGAEHVQHRRLNPEMRKLMKKMAARYPSVNTLAVNRWENGQPFTRSEIQDLRAYLVLIGAADRKERGGIELNDFGKGKLSEWAAGIFDESALPQSAASSAVQE